MFPSFPIFCRLAKTMSISVSSSGHVHLRILCWVGEWRLKVTFIGPIFSFYVFQSPRWFSVGICKYNDMTCYKFECSHWRNLKKNPLQDLLSSLNAVISTNESTRIVTGHVIYTPAYMYKFQLKTTLNSFFCLNLLVEK